MQAEKSELQKIIQTLWSSELYKIILSNPTGDGTYRKIVLNRQKKGWQAEQYTEKQVVVTLGQKPEEEETEAQPQPQQNMPRLFQ